MNDPFWPTGQDEALNYGVMLDVLWILGIVVLALIVALTAKGVERL